jgi:hypothetical protein
MEARAVDRETSRAQRRRTALGDGETCKTTEVTATEVAAGPRPANGSERSVLGPANVFQRLLSQDIGIAFAALSKFDNLGCDSLSDIVGAVPSP